MKPKILLLLCVLAVFAVFSLPSLVQVGYMGIWRAGFDNWGAAQILLDLVIASLLICAWMVTDARRLGLNAWPFVLVTLAAGSFGPLCYLLRREWVHRGEPLAATRQG